MAFIEFADATPSALPIAHSALFAVPRGAARSVEQPAPFIVTQPLSELERRVVVLAREDKVETLRPYRQRSWWARLIFGPARPSPVLANKRLEALRRLAVQTWHHGYTVPGSALQEARHAGFSEAQIGAVIDMIGRERPAVRRLAA
jgi:alkylhydroperoxidase family enzyme